MYDLKDKAVLVTGASRGIGAALVRAMAGEGARLCLIARDGQQIREVALEVKKSFGSEAYARACDVREARKVSEVVEEAAGRFGRLDLVINNAGVLGEVRPLVECDPEVWRSTIDVNLNGSFYVSRAAASLMQKSGGGRIAFVSSSVGRTMRAHWGSYAVSKWAVEGLMQLFAQERELTGVTAFSINPGGTATRMRHEAYPEEDPRRLPSAEQVAQAFLKILRLGDAQLNGRALNARDYL